MRLSFSKLGLLLMPALALVFSGTSQATVLVPGSEGFPDLFTLASPILLAEVTTPFSNADESGSVLAAVISDPNNTFGAGDLDFVYQIDNNSTSIDGLERLSASTFTGYQTDVGFATNGSLLGNGFVDGTVVPQTVDRAFANVIGFTFSPLNTVAPGSDSTLLVIETNATLFTVGNVAITDGFSTNLSGFSPTGDPSPTPEPSMTLLAGAGLLALVVVRKKFARAQ